MSNLELNVLIQTFHFLGLRIRLVKRLLISQRNLSIASNSQKETILM